VNNQSIQNNTGSTVSKGKIINKFSSQHLYTLRKFLKYKITSRHKYGHGIHSPFVFDFIMKILLDKSVFDYERDIEKVRHQLISNKKVINVTDLGAGSRANKNNQRTISDIARHSLMNKKYSRVLNKIIQHYKLSEIVELGTSFGITTSYLAKSNPNTKVTTIEGCPEIHAIANENFEFLNINNIYSINGDFDQVLDNQLQTINSIDFVLFDGNHQYSKTLDYFEKCLKKSHQDTIFVFDDIYWSHEMHNLWKTIIDHQDVSVTIDLFALGIAFFKKGLSKQYFQLRF
jgi:predicted O-methyltransferase YrrM